MKNTISPSPSFACTSITITGAVLTTLAFLFLTGCAASFSPQMLGIPDAEWKRYNEAQQRELRENYAKITAANKIEDMQHQERKKLAALNTNNALVNNTNTNNAIANNALVNNAIATTTKQPVIIEIKISNGTALMPPFTNWQAFSPAVAAIDEGSCQETLLTQLDGKAHISLRSCFKNKILSLDPSRYDSEKQNGTITIPYSPLWDHGFTYYEINSDGYVKLKGVTISVKQLSQPY